MADKAYVKAKYYLAWYEFWAGTERLANRVADRSLKNGDMETCRRFNNLFWKCSGKCDKNYNKYRAYLNSAIETARRCS